MASKTSTAQAKAPAERDTRAQGAAPDMASKARKERPSSVGRKTAEPATQPLPAWLEPDNDEHIPPAALRPLYGKLDPKITQGLEQARRGMRDGYAQYHQSVLDAHTLLAGNEDVSFKDWCEAAGINYNTAKSHVRRAEAAKRGAHAPRPPAGKGKDKGKAPVLDWTWHFKDATDKERATHIVQQVIADKHAASYEEAFLYLGELYADWVCPAQVKMVS